MASVFILVLVALPCVVSVDVGHAQQTGQRLRSGSASKEQVSVVAVHGQASAITDDNSGDDDDDDDDDDGNDEDVKQVVVTNKVAEMARKLEEKRQSREKINATHHAEISRWQMLIDRNGKKINMTKDDLYAIRNPDESNQEIDEDVKTVTQETQSAAMANFLGDMYKEMRMFGSPLYKEHLDDVVLPELMKEREKLEHGLMSAEKAWAHQQQKYEEEDQAELAAQEAQRKKALADARGEDSNEDEGAAPRRRAKTEAKVLRPGDADGRFRPMFTEKSMPAVSPTMHCVIILSFQYFAIFGFYEVLRTISRLNPSLGFLRKSEAVSEALRNTAGFAPMLSILFVGTRMKAIQLAQGDTEKYGLPTASTQTFMYMATFALTAEIIIRLITKVVQDRGGATLLICHILQSIAVFALYFGFGAVCVGALAMKAPKALWGQHAPTANISLTCTIILSVLFFVVYLALHIYPMVYEALTTYGQETFLLLHKDKAAAILGRGRDTVNIAPMLCVLFLGVRMRATQIEPDNGNPQWWAQNCIGLCTAMLVFQVFCMVGIPFQDKDSHYDSEGHLELSTSFRRRLYNIVKYVTLGSMYVGVVALVVSTYMMEHPDGPRMTPPVSPAVQCIFFLTQIYFFAQTIAFVCRTLKWAVPARVHIASETGLTSVLFAPMLCVLFLGARMRALQLAISEDGLVPPSAGPQPWVQQGMYVASWAMLVDLVMNYCMSSFIGEDQADDWKGKCRDCGGHVGALLFYVIDVTTFLSLIAMYAGVAAVICGILTMTPETLQPYSGYS